MQVIYTCTNTFNYQLLFISFNRHVDGQKIAKKLSKQITKITTSIRNTLSHYNNLQLQAGEPAQVE